jgi:hypothetical protein
MSHRATSKICSGHSLFFIPLESFFSTGSFYEKPTRRALILMKSSTQDINDGWWSHDWRLMKSPCRRVEQWHVFAFQSSGSMRPPSCGNPVPCIVIRDDGLQLQQCFVQAWTWRSRLFLLLIWSTFGVVKWVNLFNYTICRCFSQLPESCYSSSCHLCHCLRSSAPCCSVPTGSKVSSSPCCCCDCSMTIHKVL